MESNALRRPPTHPAMVDAKLARRLLLISLELGFSYCCLLCRFSSLQSAVLEQAVHLATPGNPRSTAATMSAAAWLVLSGHVSSLLSISMALAGCNAPLQSCRPRVLVECSGRPRCKMAHARAPGCRQAMPPAPCDQAATLVSKCWDGDARLSALILE